MGMHASTTRPRDPDRPGVPRPRPYPAPGLWPASSQLWVGALITIGLVLGVLLLLYFQPWSSGDGSNPGNPYGLGSTVTTVTSVHGGGPR